ncbi:MAG: peptidylprolyl isomerase [Chloroflexota bacterium]
MTFRAKPVVRRAHRPSWETEDRRNLYLNIGFGLVVLLAVLILVAAAGASYYGDHFASVATVNGETITKDDLRDRVAVDGFRLDRSGSLVRDELNSGRMTQAAADQQLSSINQARQNLASSSLERLIDATLQAQLAARESITVTEQQIDDQLVTEATHPERRHIWTIEVRPEVSANAIAPSAEQKAAAKAKADKALADLKAGTAWDEVVKGVDPAAAQGGDLGWTTKDGPFDQALLDALFAAAKDTPTEVIEGADGTYRIGRVTDIVAARTDADYQQQISDAGVSLTAYRKAVRADLVRKALDEKITAQATGTPSLMRQVSEIFLQGSPGGAPVDEVKAAHILYSPNGDPSKAKDLPADDPAWKAAEEKANATYQTLRKDPSKFAELAKTESDDKVSGADGGTLPWFKQADVDPSFAAAIFAQGLTPGQILAPVRSQFGWHVIRFDARRADASIRIKELRDQALAPGADFAALARANSDGPQAADGGALGWVARNQIAKEQEDAIFATPVGAVSEVLATPSGYYIFKVWKEETRTPDGEQLATLKAQAFRNWYAAQKAAAKIERTGAPPAATQ